MVVLIAGPRPANELPKPWSDVRASARVSRREAREHVLELGRVRGRVRDGDRVAVLEGACRARPGISSTYLRPSAERGRSPPVVSTASGSIDLSSLRSSTAMARSLPFTTTRSPLMSLTMPTRKPPARTSLPFTSLAPFGTSGPRAGRWARTEALVRLVRDEDGDDRDQHRDRADEDRACAEVSAAGPHWPSRKSRAGLVGSAGAAASMPRPRADAVAAEPPGRVGSGVVTPGCVGPRNWLQRSMSPRPA